MPYKSKSKPKPKENPNVELNKAIKVQNILQTMKKNLEQEYARLDVEFLQLASMTEMAPQNRINEFTPVVFEDEETINKKNVVLTQVQPVVTNAKVLFQDEEEEEDDEDDL